MRIAGLLVLMLLSPGWMRAQRLRPPENVGCGRDQLTSFSGKPATYRRSEGKLNLTVNTDDGTTETFQLDEPAKSLLEAHFLWESAKFDPKRWAELESAEGRLQPGVRVIVWVCKDSKSATMDWRPAPK